MVLLQLSIHVEKNWNYTPISPHAQYSVPGGIDPSVKGKTRKLLQENTGKHVQDLGAEKNFLGNTWRAVTRIEKIHKFA